MQALLPGRSRQKRGRSLPCNVDSDRFPARPLHGVLSCDPWVGLHREADTCESMLAEARASSR